MKLRKLYAPLLLCSLMANAQSYAPTTQAADPIKLQDYDGHFPFTPPTDLASWQDRREKILLQIKVSLGLWPMPTMAPVNPVVHSEREMDGYAISKVYFESLSGLYVTGSLYTPRDGKSPDTKRPGILCPHGHWDNGRFFHASDSAVKQELATGAERFESAAKNPMQARSVQLARMGCVVFLYDMIGYADSQQISLERAHRFGMHGPNPAVADGSWLLFSPQSEGYLQSVMGLQTINTLQAFEFLQSCSNVDESKIAITGASGGGTQSFIGAAIEPRIAAAMPAVMVGTHMQGGCTCENASLLRVGTGNVEFASAIAPRPLGLTSANDWTKDMANEGFPQLQQVYELYDAKKKVELHQGLHFPHNYNHVSRVAMYGFINRTFQLGFEEPILERDFEFQTRDQLTVWDSTHPAPEGGIDFEARLTKQWRDDQVAKIAVAPEYRDKGWETILSSSEALASTIIFTLDTPEPTTPANKNISSAKLTGRSPQGKVTAEASLPQQKIKSIRFESPATMSADASNANSNSASESVNSTLTVFLSDPWDQEVNDGLQPIVKNPRQAPAYTYGYNPTWMQRRVGVALGLLDQLAKSGRLEDKVHLHAHGDDVVLLSMISTARPEWIESVEVENPTDIQSIDSFRHPAFVPGMLLYAD